MDSAGGGRHLLDYWTILRRRRWVVYLAVATVVLVALIGSFLVTPLYRATVTLQIERQDPDILTFRDVAVTDYSWSAYSDFYQTQYKILASEAVARGAANQLKLDLHPLFEEQEGPSLLGRLRALLPGAVEAAPVDPLVAAAGRVLSRLEVSPVRNSHLVQISWVAPGPELAAEVANAVCDAYIQFNIQSRYSTSDQAGDFLVNQIGMLKREIAAIEDSLQSYGEAKGIISIDESNNITLRALADVAAKRTEAATDLSRKEAAYRSVLGVPAAALPEVLHSELIAGLKQEYATYEAAYSEKARMFKDDWPQMQTLRSRLEQSRERLDLETQEIARKVVLAAEAEYRKARSEVDNLDALVGRQEDLAQRLRRDAVEFANLQSEVQKKRDTLNALITRQNEMALSTRLADLDATSSNIRIVDPARPPAGPFRPNKRLNLVLGLFFGLALGVGMAFFLDYLDSTIHSAADIEPVVRLPVLAVIPRHVVGVAGLVKVRSRGDTTAGEPADLVALRDVRAAASEAYRELRTAILLSSAGRPPRQLVVTSALPEEGKSATAINLAVVLSQLGRRVLLVDTDLRRPRLHQVLGLDNRQGMTTFLSGLEQDPAKLVLPTGVSQLDFISSGPIAPNPSELLNSLLFARCGERLLEAGYDHIVYDSPPVLSVADPVIIASVVDAAILVVRADKTPRQSLRLATDKFSKAGMQPIGVVLNDLDLATQGYQHYRYYGRYEAHSPEHVFEGGDEERASGTGRG